MANQTVIMSQGPTYALPFSWLVLQVLCWIALIPVILVCVGIWVIIQIIIFLIRVFFIPAQEPKTGRHVA